MMWFSGLRGGVAFALATEATLVLPEGDGPRLIKAACLLVVIATIGGIGGTIGARGGGVATVSVVLFRSRFYRSF